MKSCCFGPRHAPRTHARKTPTSSTEKCHPTTSDHTDIIMWGTQQMHHTSTALMQHPPGTPWAMEWKFHEIKASNKLSDKNYGKKGFAAGPICHLEQTHKAKSDATALPPASFSLQKKTIPWRDNCADAVCHFFFNLYYQQTVSTLVYLLELQHKNFPGNLPIREESVKWQNNEWRQDCFNLWKTETFPLEEQLFRRTMRAASDSTLKRAELHLASLLVTAQSQFRDVFLKEL